MRRTSLLAGLLAGGALTGLALTRSPTIDVVGLYYVTGPAGDTLSTHTSYHVALESASNRALGAPGTTYRVLATVRVTARDTASPAPTPAPAPPPAPDPAPTIEAVGAVTCDATGLCTLDGSGSIGATTYQWIAQTGGTKADWAQAVIQASFPRDTVLHTWRLAVSGNTGVDTAVVSWRVVASEATPTGSLTLRGPVIRPQAVTLAPDATQQFCGYLAFEDGAVAIDRTAPAYCQANYASWFTAAEQAVTAAQQARADSVYAGMLTLSGVPWSERWLAQLRRTVGL